MQQVLLLLDGSVWMAEWLVTPDREVPGSDPAGGKILLVIGQRFIAQSLSLSHFHPLSRT